MGPYKVTYFGIPALGELHRMLCVLGKMDWEDNRIAFPQWQELKPTTKWGQLPMIEQDGRTLTQTIPMFYYLAKKVTVDGKPLFPTDDDVCFDAMELIHAFEDCRAKVVPTFSIADQAEKEAARLALVTGDGAIAQLLAKIEGVVGDKYAVGDALTIADVWAFWFCNFLVCGFLDGVPADCLAPYPKLKAITANVSSLPELKAYYSTMAESDEKYKVFAGL